MGSVVTPGNLGTEFEIGTNEPNAITLSLGAGLQKTLAGEIVVVLATTTTTKQVGFAGGSVNANGTLLYGFNATTALLAGNVYQVTFGAAHPNGSNYNVALAAQSDEPANDQRKIQWLNKTANGFQVKLSVDDNGGTADPEVQSPFDFTVFEEFALITGVTGV